jgi:hypothetical protein
VSEQRDGSHEKTAKLNVHDIRDDREVTTPTDSIYKNRKKPLPASTMLKERMIKPFPISCKLRNKG